MCGQYGRTSTRWPQTRTLHSRLRVQLSPGPIRYQFDQFHTAMPEVGPQRPPRRAQLVCVPPVQSIQ